MYVFDTMVFSQIFRFYYRRRFPSLWKRFEEMVGNKRIPSTREVKRELNDFGNGAFQTELTEFTELFPTPTNFEEDFVTEIYKVPHFRQQFPQKNLLKGGRNADPWVIARARVLNGAVVTNESEPKDSARIPNICRHFNIDCMTFEEFMEREDWTF